jgi:hypothetical protein
MVGTSNHSVPAIEPSFWRSAQVRLGAHPSEVGEGKGGDP